MATDASTQALSPGEPARSFASDNYAGIHPLVLAAIAAANEGHQPSYGQDACSLRLVEVMKAHFGPACETFCVFNGTGANVVGLQAMTEPWDAVICPSSAHVNVDECGAPERVAGLKLLAVETSDGKLTPDLVASRLSGRGDEHRAQPAVVSLSQATELGTCYSVAELEELCRFAHEERLKVHMDGARLSNAAACLDVPLRALTTDVGVDVVSFGGTKNGAMLGEAILVLNPGAASGVKYLRKASMQLASKMRFIAAQLEALLSGDLWLENARHANEMAQRLAAHVGTLDGVTITRRVESNAVFATLPRAAVAKVRERFAFYDWNDVGEVRWMTAFDTTADDVDAFAACLADALASTF